MQLFMKLRFMGKNGSMGLRKGRVYECAIYRDGNYVWVEWKTWRHVRKCPYSSMNEVLSNWSIP